VFDAPPSVVQSAPAGSPVHATHDPADVPEQPERYWPAAQRTHVHVEQLVQVP
jgi:hypothetical protein